MVVKNFQYYPWIAQVNFKTKARTFLVIFLFAILFSPQFRSSFSDFLEISEEFFSS